jgi:FkbM family methyltransferase
MWVDKADHGVGQRLYAQGFREPGFMWVLRHEAEGVVFDIGANIGYCTLQMLPHCEHVVAFEPDGRTRKFLEMNASGKPVTICPYAVWDKPGPVELIQQVRPNLSRVVTGVGVKAVILDTFFPDDTTLRLVKMDIEGGEVRAIQGGHKLLAQGPMKIAMELHPDRYGPDNDMEAQLRWLLSVGYKFKYVENAKGKLAEFKAYRPFKTFKGTDRALFKTPDLPNDDTLVKWCTTMPEDGKKVIRSILLVKE